MLPVAAPGEVVQRAEARVLPPLFRRIACASGSPADVDAARRHASLLAAGGENPASSLFESHIGYSPYQPDLLQTITSTVRSVAADLVVAGSHQRSPWPRTSRSSLATKEVGADLIVLSTRGRDSLRDTLLGTRTHRVIRKASCPVLVS